jgi:Amt family ammonium transporter
MSSGWSALVLCLFLGKRLGFGKEPMAPHSMVLCMVGTGMLWVGWYGFNAGSALAADGIAAQAFMTTTLAAAIAGFTWAVIDWLRIGKPTVLGFCSGIVGGLVTITPAAGFVTANGAVIIGVLGGVVPYFAVTYLKKWLKYDDALDTFGIHGVGGALGAILTGVLATTAVNPGIEGLTDGLVLEQIKAVLFTAVLSIVVTAILAYIIKFTIGLRPTKDEEIQGLDFIDHGESGYHYEEN